MRWKFWKKKKDKTLTIYHVKAAIPDNGGHQFIFDNPKEFLRFLSNNFTGGDIFFTPEGTRYVMSGNQTYILLANEKNNSSYFG